MRRKGIGVDPNPSDGCLNHVPELATQASPLLFIVGCGFVKLGFRLRVQDDRLHGYALRSSAKTSSAGRPVALPV